MAGKRDIQDLCKQLDTQGFDVEKARNGHWKVTAPDGRKIQIPATPRHNRGILNAITRLKRIGFEPCAK